MELILKKPIEELIPKSIDWNNADLLSIVKKDLEKYEGRIYDDNSISVAKSDRAKLNGFCKQLNEWRLEVKRKYEEPYLKFKAEVDEVINSTDKVMKDIDGQVKTYEKTRDETKANEIKTYFDSVIGELVDFIKYEQLYSEKWLNVTVSLKSIKEEIDAKLQTISNEIATIETLKSEDENSLKAFYFRTLNLASALQENERLKAEKLRIAEYKAKCATTVAKEEPKANVAPVEAPKAEQTQQPSVKTYEVTFTVTGTATELNTLSAYLKANNYKYQTIKEN